MKTLKTIVLPVAAIFVIAMTLSSSMAFADTVPIGFGPSTGLSVYFLKKSFDFCDNGLSVSNAGSNIPGGSVPFGENIQSSGCVDYTYENGEQIRKSNYLFAGEQVADLVVARDLSGALAIDHAIMQVDGSDVAYCNEVKVWDICKWNPTTSKWYQCSWKGHSGTDLDNLIAEYPLQASMSTNPGFDQNYDKLFECFLTATDAMSGSSDITVQVTDSVNDQTASTGAQTWFFNPAVSMDISLSSGDAVAFQDGAAGDLVYSTNTLKLENSAEGMVDIAVWLGGTDLSSPDMAAKCPYTNVLDSENMQFRCTLDQGVYVEQDWQTIKTPIIKEECEKVSRVDHTAYCLDLNPLFDSSDTSGFGDGHDNILVNGHEADCSFKLKYPVPCIGSFTDGNLIILMRAV